MTHDVAVMLRFGLPHRDLAGRRALPACDPALFLALMSACVGASASLDGGGMPPSDAALPEPPEGVGAAVPVEAVPAAASAPPGVRERLAPPADGLPDRPRRVIASARHDTSAPPPLAAEDRAAGTDLGAASRERLSADSAELTAPPPRRAGTTAVAPEGRPLVRGAPDTGEAVPAMAQSFAPPREAERQTSTGGGPRPGIAPEAPPAGAHEVAHHSLSRAPRGPIGPAVAPAHPPPPGAVESPRDAGEAVRDRPPDPLPARRIAEAINADHELPSRQRLVREARGLVPVSTQSPRAPEHPALHRARFRLAHRSMPRGAPAADLRALGRPSLDRAQATTDPGRPPAPPEPQVREASYEAQSATTAQQSPPGPVRPAVPEALTAPGAPADSPRGDAVLPPVAPPEETLPAPRVLAEARRPPVSPPWQAARESRPADAPPTHPAEPPDPPEVSAPPGGDLPGEDAQALMEPDPAPDAPERQAPEGPDGAASALATEAASTAGADGAPHRHGASPAATPTPVLREPRPIAAADTNARPVERLVIELDPPELGRCEVELQSREGRVRAILVADRPETVVALRSVEGQVREQFALHDLRIEDFEVRHGGQGAQHDLRQGAGDGSRRDGQAWQFPHRQPAAPPTLRLPAAAPVARAPRAGRNAIDLVA